MIATRSQVDAEGRYTGELEMYAYGPGKAEAVKDLAAAEELDLAGCYAYSDSATDLPLMETVGHPVAVNPDKELRRIAEERNWPVLVFTRQVSLRTRLVPNRLTGAALAVAVGILVAVALRHARRQGT